ncbi:MAG: hypothetical protein U0414_10925 [Polyangiaceae bacterium]
MRLGDPALHPATVLPAYLDTLVRGRRVAVLGDSSLGIGELFLERGARIVHVFDRDAGRAAEAAARHSATRGRVQFSPFVDDLAVRRGAFDIAIVPDLSVLSDLAETVRVAKRLVPPGGLAVFATPNPDAERWLLPPSEAVGDAPGYYELYDLIAAEFSEVRMLGQAPFVGYAIVDFAAADPEVSIDTSSLAQAEVPEWYVAVASERPLDLSTYAVVEVALSDVSRATISSEPNTLPRGVSGESAALSEANQRIAELHAENERLVLEARLTLDATTERERANDALAMRAADIERDLAEWKNRCTELERVATEARARADRTSHQVKDLDEELGRQRDRATRLTRDLDEATKARVRAEETAHTRQLSSETMVIDTRLAVELATMHERVRELEAALAEAGDPPTLRSLQNAQSARIVELERRESELMVRASGLEQTVEELRQAGEELRRAGEEHRLRAEEQQRVGDEQRRIAEEQRRIAEEQRRVADEQRRTSEERRQTIDQLLGRATQLEEELSAATTEMGRLTIETERLAFEVREAEYRRLAADQALAMAREGSDDALAEDLRVLEEHLVERGHEVGRLTREIREAARVGRERLEELAARDAKATVTGSASEADRAQLARLQADAAAASWKIAQLERELAARPPIPPAADARTRALEEALVAAQREISELRFALRGVEVTDASEREGSGAAP